MNIVIKLSLAHAETRYLIMVDVGEFNPKYAKPDITSPDGFILVIGPAPLVQTEVDSILTKVQDKHGKNKVFVRKA